MTELCLLLRNYEITKITDYKTLLRKLTFISAFVDAFPKKVDFDRIRGALAIAKIRAHPINLRVAKTCLEGNTHRLRCR